MSTATAQRPFLDRRRSLVAAAASVVAIALLVGYSALVGSATVSFATDYVTSARGVAKIKVRLTDERTGALLPGKITFDFKRGSKRVKKITKSVKGTY
jgi:hypothetical protein